MRTRGNVLSLSAVLLFAFSALAQADDWLQFDRDPRHSGNNPDEKVIHPRTVGGLALLYRAELPDVADGAPAYLGGVRTSAGLKDLLFVTTRDGHVLGLDAVTGRQVWVHQNPANGLTINNAGQPCYTTASPAVDPDRRFVYSYGLDGYVHKYRVEDGQEVRGDGWPEPATLKPWDEKGSSDLSIATDRQGTPRLYVTNSGYLGDFGNYQGHVTTIDLRTGAQNVFNANCSDQAVHFAPPPGPGCPSVQTGIWGRAGVVYDRGLDRIFTATGNGAFDPAQHDWGDSVLALDPEGKPVGGNPRDSYTPQSFRFLNDADVDLGSTIPAILPRVPGCRFAHLGVQAGKDALLRLLDLADLSGRSGPGHLGGEIEVVRVPQGGRVLTAPAVWTNPADGSCWFFVSNASGISGLQVVAGAGGKPRMVMRWVKEGGGTSPVVAGEVLFYAGSNRLQALRPTSGEVLWESTQIGRVHWESPIVVDGRLYISDEAGVLSAFGLR